MNIITAAINSFGKSVTCPLYQWDYGQILMITGITLPDAYEVNFAQGTDTCTVIGTADGVDIPDEYLQNAADIIAYLYLHTGEADGETVYELTIPVIARPEPSHEEPTPVQQSEITQLVAALNTAVDEAEGYAHDAQEAAESIPEHVLVYDAQSLTDSQKAQARANIGASDVAYEIKNLKDGSYNHSIRMTSAADESEYAEEHMGGYAAAFGSGTKASGGGSFAVGWNSEASNTASCAEGRDTVSSGQAAHAEGLRSIASASQAHAEGRDTVASGTISHAEGEGTIANHRAQTVAGQWNIADPASGAETERGTYVEIIGNGTADDARSNARTLDWNGNEKLAGKLTVGAPAVNANDVPTLSQVQGMIPTVPTNVSAFTNDAGYQTASDLNAALLASLITDTASGDPCAITDGANAPVVDCKVSIVPKQSGSGTPAPDNVRPISGWTEMTMKRMGKNLCYTDSYVVPKNSIRNTVWEGDLTGTFTVSVEKSGITSVTRPNEAIALVKVDGVKQELIYQTGKLTVTGNVTMIEVWGYEAYARAVGTLGIQMEVGSTATEYERYTEYDYTQSWDTTVYGGSLDLTTGVLTVEYAMVDLGTLTWNYLSGLNSFESKTLKDVVQSNTNLWCTALEHALSITSANWSGYDKVIGINRTDTGATITGNFANGSICAKDSDYTTASDFTTAMSGVYLCYGLANPTETIQLTPTEVQTILGSNTFSADTGSVEIKYRADTELWVEGHVPSKTSQLTNDSGFITASNAPVRSVNGKTGVVTIANATTSAAGLMSATDKANLDAVVADYSSAITALGV